MNVLDLKPLKNLLSGYKSQGRTMLLPALHSTQNLYGYISQEAAIEISKSLNIPLAEVFGVIEFYTLFHSKPVGKTIVHVCNDPVCAMAGSESILKMMSSSPLVQEGLSLSQEVTVEYAHCLGLCEHAPALLVDGEAVKGKKIESLDDVFLDESRQPLSYVGGDIRNLTKNCGNTQPTNMDAYIDSGGYEALQKAVRLLPIEIIKMVKSSGLVGRGGAAFPTGIKWESASKEESPVKYLVCNGDEAEPGTFTSR